MLDVSDAAFSQFKVMVTQANGAQVAMSLAALGITSIDLTGDATHAELPDGSVITGQSSFTCSDEITGLVGDVDTESLMMRVCRFTGAQYNHLPR